MSDAIQSSTYGRAALRSQQRPQVFPGPGGLAGRNVLGCAGGDDLAAAFTALRTQVYHPVGGLDDIEVVLDHHDGVALVAQAVQDMQQLLDVVEMQPGGGLVQDVEGLAGGTLGELSRQLHALRLTARERGGVLSEAHVREADVGERLELAGPAGTVWKKRAASSTVMSSTSWMFLPR